MSTINSYHMDKSQTVIYWAGALFNHKEVIGNLTVAKAVENVSDGRYIVKLPQDLQTSPSAAAVDIRNADLTELIQCDALVANFDGADLDSGTVVEFCVAKALDMPTVLLRTDFRNCGDADGIPWNLMCAGWPRTEILWTNSLADYHRHPVEDLSKILADKIIHSLDKACAMKPWLTDDDAAVHFRRTVQSIGGGLAATLSDETIAAIVERKRRKGLLA